MTGLAGHVEDYLRLRRALGFKLAREGYVLPQLVAYVEAAGSATLTNDLAIAWALLPQSVAPINWSHRLGSARGFATYLKTIDPATEIPPRGVLAVAGHRPTPYLWSHADIGRLLEGARELPSPLQAATFEAFFGLLAVSGMRVGEALGLGRGDADLTDGVLTLREPKFGHARLVPLHPSARDALRSYALHRDRLSPASKATTFFISPAGTALAYGEVHKTFVQLTTAMGIRTAAVRPRIHDLRHSFAVHTLINAYRTGADVEGRVAVLSTYLGHVNPAGTYWYLHAAPELLELAAARLNDSFGGPR